jgi:hypothetical protein
MPLPYARRRLDDGGSEPRGCFRQTVPVTEPEVADASGASEGATPETLAIEPPRRRLRAIPAFAVASMLLAGGLLMAVGGMARLVGPAPPTPTPTVAPTAAPTLTPIVPSTGPLGPTASPRG